MHEIGTVPVELHQKIADQKELSVLNGWVKKAARAESIEDFIKAIEQE